MEGMHVLLAQSFPSLAIRRSPEIAGQAADKALTSIIDLNELLATLVAAVRFMGFGRHDQV